MYMYADIIKDNDIVVLQYAKLTKPLSFQTRFPQNGPTYNTPSRLLKTTAVILISLPGAMQEACA